MMPPVGKSGPGRCSSNSSVVTDGLSSTARAALMVSLRLWVGILVAMPTAMPPPPLTSMLGKRAGRTVGSFSDPS
ncbi:hypothetical protein D3C73_1621190 [compost metagenome]